MPNCAICGNHFAPNPSTHHPVKTCSAECTRESRRRSYRGARRVTPESTRQERARAQGLVNMRIRRHKAERPARCEECGQERPVDAHHDNYSQPDQVKYLCRSCHMKRHHLPLAEVQQ